MPPENINERMIALEDALEEIEDPASCRHAYSRTGNDLKEFVYYISDRDEFMTRLNAALMAHPRFPIEIGFYEDKEWLEFTRLLADFTDKNSSGASND